VIHVLLPERAERVFSHPDNSKPTIALLDVPLNLLSATESSHLISES
jgi:hypothetical protein